jgi:DNA-binding NarL/FixJ family response regulator
MEQTLSPTIRILIADDYKDWRRQVRLLFQARPEWQVIAEAADGSEVIQKAEELKPDLIVLDIGLPKLNGIEVAHRIREVSPSTKIVFLSQNSDLYFVRTALGTGALAYVHKTAAQSELLLAVDAVLGGKRFVSSRLKGYEFTESSAEKAPHRHEVLFYSDDTVLLDRLARLIAGALKAGDAAVVIATKAHRESLVQRLKAEAVDIDDALHRGTYISLDAADTLSMIIVNDLPDPVRFFEGIGGFIEAAARAAKSEEPRVVVFGEAVALLQAEGKADAAIRFEQLGNDLLKTHKVDILCAYPSTNFEGKEDHHVFQSICAEHSASIFIEW